MGSAAGVSRLGATEIKPFGNRLSYRFRRSRGLNGSAGEEPMKTCLIVDDSSVIRKVARRILEELEFQIAEAENGEEALEACRRRLPDAILLDWNMPKMDGYDFLRLLRRLPGGDRPKVVFCTTENDVAHIARALHAGANEYIMKPFDKEIVEAKFQEVGLV
jgi:two-component system, chemotaxis family, chemotaxis protein CheY